MICTHKLTQSAAPKQTWESHREHPKLAAGEAWSVISRAMTGRPRERGWALARAADLLQLSRRHADCKSWAVGTAEGALPSHTFQANGSISRHWKNASTRPHTRILRLIYAHSARSAPLTAPCSTGASSDVASGLPRLGYGLDEGPVSKLSLLEGRKCLRTPKSVRGPIGKRWWNQK